MVTDMSNAEVFIDIKEHRINKESMFHISNSGLLASGGIISLYIKSPDKSPDRENLKTYIIFKCETSKKGNLVVYENCDIGSSGTILIPNNKKRESNILYTGLCKKDVAITSAEKELLLWHMSGSEYESSMWILDFGVGYVFRFNSTENDNSAGMELEFYEVN